MAIANSGRFSPVKSYSAGQVHETWQARRRDMAQADLNESATAQSGLATAWSNQIEGLAQLGAKTAITRIEQQRRRWPRAPRISRSPDANLRPFRTLGLSRAEAKINEWHGRVRSPSGARLMDVSSLAAAMASVPIGRRQLAAAARMMKMNSDNAAAMQLIGRFANGLGQNLDTSA